MVKFENETSLVNFKEVIKKDKIKLRKNLIRNIIIFILIVIMILAVLWE